MQLPINIRRTRQCPRCGLDYPISEPVCPHCHGLSDREVETLKQQYKAESVGERHLGWLFIYIAILIVIGILIFGLTG
jgi:hypothetical protein